MKAVLLAAGEGNRLRPLTDDTPKCLLPVCGIPLLQIWLENCEAAGIREVLINAHTHPQKIRDFASSQTSRIYTTIVEEKELLGSAGTLKENRAFLEGENDFFVLYADVLTNASLTAMLEFHRNQGKLATLGVYEVPDPSRCGIVSVDRGGTIQSFVEKPANPESNWAFSGVMIASPDVLDLIPEQRPADLGFHLLPRLVGKMAAYRIHEYVLDIGTPHNYTAAQETWPGALAR